MTPCPLAQAALYAVWLGRILEYTSVLNYFSGLGGHPKQAATLLPDMLKWIFVGLISSDSHTAWRAAVLCSFRVLLRKCQVMVSESALMRSNFSFQLWGMLVCVRRSKTILFSEPMLEIPVARCPDPSLCVVHWVEKHFQEVPPGPDAMAFRVTTGAVISTNMQYSAYQGMLKYVCEQAGLDPGDYSSHSLR